MARSTFKNTRTKLLSLVEKMSVSEKIFFGILLSLLIISALVLLKRASDMVSIEVPIEGGTLVEGVVGYPRSINPLLPVTDSGRDLTNLIYSGLMKVSPKGTLVPDLAESYTISEDGLTYTFTLKDDIYFQDNTEVTAYDVEFTVKKVTDPIIKSPLSANWDGITVEAPDSKTVVFRLNRPYAPFIENMTLGILPMHIWKDVGSDAFLFSEFNIEPIGSGPYRIKEIKRNASGLPTYYHLTPFSRYASGEPYIGNIFVYFYTTEKDLITAYESGAIDSMSSISPESAMKVNKSRSKIIETPLPRYYAVFLNQNQSKILADSDIRKALRLATPQDAIISNVLFGFATPIQSPLLSGMSALPEKTTTDSEGLLEAKELLEENDWTVSSTTGIRSKKGQALSFSLSVPDVQELKQTAEHLKTAWKELGVEVSIKVFDSSDLEQNVIVPRQYDALLFGEAVGRNVDLYPFWASSERNYPGQNIVQYVNTKADKALADARLASDSEARLKLYQAFEKEVDKDIPAIFLYAPDLIYVLPQNLKGISLQGVSGASERFSNIEDWYVETENVWKFPWIKEQAVNE
ncbi:MAG: ABC transporter substrate-binding protein [Candidatus Paceibacterota bacterium]|jgi:peptide/nickel transport system substrate-binding protein